MWLRLVLSLYGSNRHSVIDKHITCKVVIDNKTKEVKIILGKFETEVGMYNAAEVICDALNIEFVAPIKEEEFTYH